MLRTTFFFFVFFQANQPKISIQEPITMQKISIGPYLQKMFLITNLSLQENLTRKSIEEEEHFFLIELYKLMQIFNEEIRKEIELSKRRLMQENLQERGPEILQAQQNDENADEDVQERDTDLQQQEMEIEVQIAREREERQWFKRIVKYLKTYNPDGSNPCPEIVE